MDFSQTKIPYGQTGFFSKIVTDYLQQGKHIRPFFNHEFNEQGLQDAIEARKKFKTNRTVLAAALKEQYKELDVEEPVAKNLQLLTEATTFTITTAHQPNIFTGPLYFLYKILHAVKLSEYCKEQFPQYDFVPVYYMGSEDADIDELGHIYLNGQKISWHTHQTGAVGRMRVDKALLKIIDRIAAETGVLQYGHEIILLLKKYYAEGTAIQEATLGLVNELFGKYGLITLIADTPLLKALAVNVFKDELLNQHSFKIVEDTGKRLQDAGYNAQAHTREINLFYLVANSRLRIVKDGENWRVNETAISFSKEALLQELQAHPERFSPNVILRGLYQEMILPDIAFIGGGGELAYWLQLKDLFEYYKVPYPMLLLRNSFLIIEERANEKINKLGFNSSAMFQTTKKLQDKWVKNKTANNLSIANALSSIEEVYTRLSCQAETIDTTLLQHIDALKNTALKRIQVLEKKMLRAEKRNYGDAMRQIEKLKEQLFPFGNLQERIDNFIPYYAKLGSGLIYTLYKNSLALEQEFVVLQELA